MRKDMKHLIFLITMIVSFSLFGQNIELKGKIVDLQSRSALQGANVYLINKKIGTTSSSDGYFNLIINKADFKDTLVVDFLGYKEYKIEVEKYTNYTTIFLIEDILSLSDRITVYGEKFNVSKMEIPHIANIIDAQQIKLHGSREISDLFKIDPSIRIEGNELDGKSIQIRGSDADEVNVYLDGILLNNVGNDNIADLSIIPIGNIEKIEIIKGANLGLLGSGAFGGVVNLTSQKKRFQEYKLEFKYGSAEKNEINAEANIPISEKIYLNYYGAISSISPEIEYFSTETYDETKTTSDIISLDKHNHYFNFDYNIENGQITSKLIGYTLDYDRTDWNTFKQNLMFATTYNGNLFDVRNIDIGLNYIFSDVALNRNAPENSEFLSSFLSQRVNLKLAKNFILVKQYDSEFNIQVLGEYFHDEIFNSLDWSNQNNTFRLYEANMYENRSSFGGVATFVNILDSLRTFQWKSFAGFRGEFLPNGKWYQLSTFGVQVDFSRKYWNLSPYFSFGDNLKIPSLQDQAYLLHLNDLTSSYDEIEPIKLIPENTTSAEIGLKLQYLPKNLIFDNITMDFSWYSTGVFNKLLKEKYDNIYIEKQIGEAKINGIEASIRLNNLFKRLYLTASFGLLDVNDLMLYAYKPDSKYSLQLGVQLENGFSGSAILFYEGESIAFQPNVYNEIETIKLKPFQDMDISFAYNFSISPITIGINLIANNIFDSAGFQYYYLKKRFLQAGISLRY
jgi:outer membrane cobalamin receptor